MFKRFGSPHTCEHSYRPSFFTSNHCIASYQPGDLPCAIYHWLAGQDGTFYEPCIFLKNQKKSTTLRQMLGYIWVRVCKARLSSILGLWSVPCLKCRRDRGGRLESHEKVPRKGSWICFRKIWYLPPLHPPDSFSPYSWTECSEEGLNGSKMESKRRQKAESFLLGEACVSLSKGACGKEARGNTWMLLPWSTIDSRKSGPLGEGDNGVYWGKCDFV